VFDGAPQAVLLGRDMGLRVRTAGGLDRPAFFAELAACAGLISLPNDLAPSPRAVVEARLMGRRLILNANVQHREESWFAEGTPARIAQHLQALPSRFWTAALA
jgi:hypothetical protein